MGMKISDVRFAITSDTLNMLQVPEPVYRSFSGKVDDWHGSGPPDIRILLRLGDMPNTENLKKLFVSEQSWSMLEDRDHYYLTLDPPAFSLPLWVAEVDRGFTEVVVHCGQGLVSTRDGRTVVSNPVC